MMYKFQYLNLFFYIFQWLSSSYRYNNRVGYQYHLSSIKKSSTILHITPPSTYSRVEKDCLNSINKFIQLQAQCKRLSVDVLTPGLNPKLEQKAILLQEYLFALVYEISLILSVQFNNVKLYFPSIGDAASYQVLNLNTVDNYRYDMI